MRSLARTHPTAILKYGSGMERLLALQDPPEKPIPVVKWFHGASGTGKTYTAAHEHGIDPAKVCRSNADSARTFQQYRPDVHTRFVFENFHHSCIKHGELLQYLDEVPTQVKVLYGVNWFVPKEIYITCSYPPSWYWSGNELTEVERRLKEIREFTAVYSPNTPVTVPNTPSLRCEDEDMNDAELVADVNEFLNNMGMQ